MEPKTDLPGSEPFIEFTYLNGTWGIKVLYHFTGGSDGADPQSHPVLDNAGNLYGATSGGGSNGEGVVFELTPTSSGWTEKVLYDFTLSADGFNPSAGVILDNAGNLYGTTSFGGPHAGTIFELVPNSNGTWTHKVLYGFPGGADGGGPTSGGLVRDSAGNLYGTTGYGGSTGRGTIFELSPGSNGAWTFHVLHSFCVRTNCSDGEPGSGFASVILDSHGNLYGMTSFGGQVSASCPAAFIDGCGTAFKLTHTTTGAWTFQRLYAFCSLDGCIDGKDPGGGLVLDGTGNLYGTTLAGGSQDFGTVYRLSHVPGSPWTEDVLHSFCALPDCADGTGPLGSLVLDTAGNLFGTTLSDVFEVIP